MWGGPDVVIFSEEDMVTVLHTAEAANANAHTNAHTLQINRVEVLVEDKY